MPTNAQQALSPEQSRLIERDQSVVAIGNGGSGRTTAMLRRAERLVSIAGASRVRYVACSTMTAGLSEALDKAQVQTTFGRLGIELWKRRGRRSADSLPKIINSAFRRMLVQLAINRVGADITVEVGIEGIRRAKASGFTLRQGHSNLQGFKLHCGPKASAETLAAVADDYERQLYASGAMDEDDLSLLPALEIESSNSLPFLEIDHLLVDDAQQLSWAGWRLLRHIGSACKTTAVSLCPIQHHLHGDVSLQSSIDSLITDCKAAVVYFEKSYVAGSGNLARFESTFRNVTPKYPVTTTSQRLAAESIVYREHESTPAMALGVIAQIEADIKKGVGIDRILLTYRLTDMGEILRPHLQGASLDVRIWDQGGLTESRPAKALRAAYMLSKQRDNVVALSLVADMVPDVPIHKALIEAGKLKKSLPEAALTMDGGARVVHILQRLSEFIDEGTAGLASFLGGAGLGLNLWGEESQRLTELTRWVPRGAFSNPEVMDAMDRLCRGEWEYRSDSPCIWCIPNGHLTSGEWDIVHVLGFSDEIYPLAGEDETAERALLAMAVMRARNCVYLHHAKNLQLGIDDVETPMKPSYILNEVGFKIERLTDPKPSPSQAPRMDM